MRLSSLTGLQSQTSRRCRANSSLSAVRHPFTRVIRNDSSENRPEPAKHEANALNRRMGRAQRHPSISVTERNGNSSLGNGSANRKQCKSDLIAVMGVAALDPSYEYWTRPSTRKPATSLARSAPPPSRATWNSAPPRMKPCAATGLWSWMSPVKSYPRHWWSVTWRSSGTAYCRSGFQPRALRSSRQAQEPRSPGRAQRNPGCQGKDASVLEAPNGVVRPQAPASRQIKSPGLTSSAVKDRCALPGVRHYKFLLRLESAILTSY